MTGDPVSDAVAALCAPAARVSTSRRAEAPRAPGIYAWWSTEPNLLGIPGTPLGGSFLYYVGITKSARSLRSRLAKHATGKARSSTLRLTLAALGAVLTTPLSAGGSKVSLAPGAETELTPWIANHLEVSWFACDEPGPIEATIIGEMRPPLNIEHNKSHPMCATVGAARAAFRSRAMPVYKARLTS